MTNKSLLNQSSTEAPAPVPEDQPASTAATTESTTGAPAKKEETEEATPPAYVDEGKEAPAEKSQIVQGEEVKVPTTEVSASFSRSPGSHFR